MPPHGDHLRVFDRPVPKQLSVSWRTTFELGGISAALFYLLGCWSFWPWLLFIFTLLDGLCRKGRKIGLFDVIHLIIYGVATAKYLSKCRILLIFEDIFGLHDMYFEFCRVGLHVSLVSTTMAKF